MKSRKPSKAELKVLFRAVGATQQEVADKLSEVSGERVSQQVVQNWLRRERVPVEWVMFIVQASGGEVPAHRIRPDVFPGNV